MALVVRSHGRLTGSDDQLVCVVDDGDSPESERPYIIFRFEHNGGSYAHTWDVSPMFADFHDVDEARGLAQLARHRRLTGRPGAWVRP